jgi:hypothetical protein
MAQKRQLRRPVVKNLSNNGFPQFVDKSIYPIFAASFKNRDII